jgi:cytochrome c oxidase subunit 2
MLDRPAATRLQRHVHPFDRAEHARKRCTRALQLFLAAPLLTGCEGPQSTLDPAGIGAERIAELFWWLTACGAVIWTIVVALAIYAIRVRRPHDRRRAAILIIGGGAVVPTIVLAAILTAGLGMMPRLLEPAPDGSLEIHVTGEQWWWRVRYVTPEGEQVELANEVRLPVGEPVQFYLDSPDVIHSFWIPSIGGKMDMVPGRTTRLTLEASRTGTFRGVCAEYCGDSHALMAFYAVVVEPNAFDAWLQQQAEPAVGPADPTAARGEALFLETGCGACHTVRGIAAAGVVGPDLTHVGSRVSLGAGIMPNDAAAFARWITETETVKPGVHMPAFGMLPDEDVRALAAHLDGLQ